MFLDTIYHHQIKMIPHFQRYLEGLGVSDKEDPQGQGSKPIRPSLKAALVDHSQGPLDFGIIAEFKRRSPAMPTLAPLAHIQETLDRYTSSSVCGQPTAISILTEPTYFGGQFDDLKYAAATLKCPILMKDFMVHPVQIQLAAALGASAILLIAEMPVDHGHLIATAHSLGLEVMMEIHSFAAYQTIAHLPFDVLGINNRNLQTLEVSTATTPQVLLQIAQSKGPKRIVISESGLASPDDLSKMASLKVHGLRGALIGQSLMTHENPSAQIAAFRGHPKKKTFIKLCGIVDPETAKYCDTLGVDAIGVVFAKSKRRVTLEGALKIKEALTTTDLVAVFKDQEPREVEAMVKQLMPRAIQVYDQNPYNLPPGVAIIRALSSGAMGAKGDKGDKASPPAPLAILIDHPQPGNGETWTWKNLTELKGEMDHPLHVPMWVAGGLTPDNVGTCLHTTGAEGVDVSSGIEVDGATDGTKDHKKIKAFVMAVRGFDGLVAKGEDTAPSSAPPSPPYSAPDAQGYFGDFGGRFMPETLAAPLARVKEAFEMAKADPKFKAQMAMDYRDYIGRATPLYFAERFSAQVGAQVFLKREDLCHTGAHKINNALGQGRLAARMGFGHLIAETGAGQHGIATATVAAKLGMSCTVFMGAKDVARQAHNVDRMRRMGAEVVAVDKGTGVLKDATSEALRYWVAHPDTCFYVIGSAIGPAPYPEMVRHFQSIIGTEARAQILDRTGQLPSEIVAAVGGGSNAIGIFTAFIDDSTVTLTGVEAAGLGLDSPHHAATLTLGRPGVFHGTAMLLLQDAYGNIQNTHSISAGLDYSGVGPEHCHLKTIGRAQYKAVTDDEVLRAFHLLLATEGIIPALESAHALAYVIRDHQNSGKTLIVNLSGRGDKDLAHISQSACL